MIWIALVIYIVITIMEKNPLFGLIYIWVIGLSLFFIVCFFIILDMFYGWIFSEIVSKQNASYLFTSFLE